MGKLPAAHSRPADSFAVHSLGAASGMGLRYLFQDQDHPPRVLDTTGSIRGRFLLLQDRVLSACGRLFLLSCDPVHDSKSSQERDYQGSGWVLAPRICEWDHADVYHRCYPDRANRYRVLVHGEGGASGRRLASGLSANYCHRFRSGGNADHGVFDPCDSGTVETSLHEGASHFSLWATWTAP